MGGALVDSVLDGRGPRWDREWWRALVVCKSTNCFAVLVAVGERHI